MSVFVGTRDAHGHGMLAKTFSASPMGIDGMLVQIEAALQRGLPSIHITGLPNDVIRESCERIRACLSAFGFETPSSRIVIHLSPATTKKQGSQFDLAIAMGILKAEGILRDRDLSRTAFLGELGLDGGLRGVIGAISLVEILEQSPDIHTILLPSENSEEVALLSPKKVRLAAHISEVIDFIENNAALSQPVKQAPSNRISQKGPTLNDVIGLDLAKRALQIALAGRHHLCFIGPPGVGKSLLASCAPNLLPELSDEERIEVVRNYSVGKLRSKDAVTRPFRAPHHSISAAGLLGGGSGIVLPGEITLAHHGVLFLDEFPEFRRDAIEGLREPMQNGKIHLHRVGHSLSLPARFTLIAAMNPCPCGNYLSPKKSCRCSFDKISQYQRRVSGPIFDRMDLCLILNPPTGTLKSLPLKTHTHYHEEVTNAFRRQLDRYAGDENGIKQNGDLNSLLRIEAFDLFPEEQRWLDQLTETGQLSFRSLFKILKVARTIADLEGTKNIRLPHLLEAKALRCPDSYMA